LLSCSFGFSNPNSTALASCPAPTNLTKTFQSTSSVGFDWDDCGCSPTEYRAYFVRGGQASPEYSTTDSNITFSGLSAGTYQFHFYTVCGGVVSSIIIEE